MYPSTPSPTQFGEDKRKHLEFIQNVITRMNSNSFQIKGWAVTIVSALIALFASTKEVAFLFVCVLPIILFAGLDTYYLQMERKFRSLYSKAISNSLPLYDMNIGENSIKRGKNNQFWTVFTSPSIWAFYVFLALVLVFAVSLIYSTSRKDTKEPLKVSVVDTLHFKMNGTSHIQLQDTLNIKEREEK